MNISAPNRDIKHIICMAIRVGFHLCANFRWIGNLPEDLVFSTAYLYTFYPSMTFQTT